ncbi:DUF5926 family protein [Corynebacterium pacaense]|uniref:DUF5926 family protein n=1 Tax=Corynebacterium pacaense TaxID=1816684 RepID=UPI0009BC4865|nr:DUF5926 family protein [Corynebacterium pacaense]
MAKKNKKSEQLPEGMSRRQAKLAARAAEREALDREPRPFEGLAMEADLVALQEFIPSATAPLDIRGSDRTVTVCTVLPGAVAALVRDEEHGSEAFVALQQANRSNTPGRDLAFALNWIRAAAAGTSLTTAKADGTQPELTELIDASATLTITPHQDFNWWLAEGDTQSPQVAQHMQAANESILPSHPVEVDVPGAIWWVNPGGKAHIRWVRTEEENALLLALARIAARGELHLGADTRFAGVFRTHGITVPVWDLDPERPHTDYADAILALNAAIAAELANDAQLTPEERRQLENIKSRQVTIR